MLRVSRSRITFRTSGTVNSSEPRAKHVAILDLAEFAESEQLFCKCGADIEDDEAHLSFCKDVDPSKFKELLEERDGLYVLKKLH